MSVFSTFLIGYYESLQDRLCAQDLIDTCSGTKETTPTLSGTTISGVSTVEITNYDIGNFYAEVVSSGTVSRTDDTITWNSDGVGTLAVYAADDGFVLSDPGLWTVGIFNFINGKPWKSQYDINTVDNGDLGTWTQGTFLPSQHGVSQAIVTKSRVYLLGGYYYFNGDDYYLSTVYTAPITSSGTIGTWTTDTSLPGILHSSQAIVTNSRVYLLGGMTSTVNVVSTVYTAPINPDGTLGTWTTDTSLPVALAGSQAVVTESRVYLLGGRESSGYRSNIYTAPINPDGTLGTWALDTNTLPKNNWGMPSIMTKSRVYLLAGHSDDRIWYAPINPDGTLGTWALDTNTVPVDLAETQAVVTRDRAYLLGGHIGSAYTGAIYSAPIDGDGIIGSWTYSSGMSNGMGYSQAVVTSSRLYMLGGVRGTTVPFYTMVTDYTDFSGGYNDYMDKSYE